jgi:hypothetical protein
MLMMLRMSVAMLVLVQMLTLCGQHHLAQQSSELLHVQIHVAVSEATKLKMNHEDSDQIMKAFRNHHEI